MDKIHVNTSWDWRLLDNGYTFIHVNWCEADFVQPRYERQMKSRSGAWPYATSSDVPRLHQTPISFTFNISTQIGWDTHTRTHAHTHTRAHTHIYTRTHTHTRAHAHAQAHAQARAQAHAHAHSLTQRTLKIGTPFGWRLHLCQGIGPNLLWKRCIAFSISPNFIWRGTPTRPLGSKSPLHCWRSVVCWPVAYQRR